MGRYVVRRVLWMFVVLWIVATVIFFLPSISPIGDPAIQLCPRGCTPAQLEQVRARLKLDDHVVVRYKRFLVGHDWLPTDRLDEDKGLLDLPPNFGYSFKNQEPVLGLLMSRVSVTASLAFGAAIMWLAMGVPIGILAATKPRSIRDRVATLFALFGVSMPTFFLGLIMLYLFFFRLTKAGVLLGGQPLFPPGYVPFAQDPLEYVQHLILPCFTLAFVNAAVYSRMVRGTLLEVLGEDYIRTARAKGLSRRRVIYRHGLRSALTPVVTLLGLDLGTLLGGAIITEKLFTLPGIGALLINAIFNLDLPVVMGAVLFASFFVVVSNIVIDVVYAMLDARVRYS